MHLDEARVESALTAVVLRKVTACAAEAVCSFMDDVGAADAGLVEGRRSGQEGFSTVHWDVLVRLLLAEDGEAVAGTDVAVAVAGHDDVDSGERRREVREEVGLG